jgi:hypothetical protein
MNPNDAPPSEPQWLSVGDFAAARRLSVRTVKRYIEAGDVETKKESGRRFVRDFQKGQAERDTAKVPKGTEGTEGTPQKGQDGADVSLHAQEEGQKGHGESARSAKRDTPEGTKGTEAVSLLALSGEAEAGEVARLRADLERERDGAAFLRGVIEQLQRDGAEVRAALRKALELAPKQLEAPPSAPSPVAPDESARIERRDTKMGAARTHGPNVSEGAETGGNDGESLTYGDIADALERMLNG